MISAHYHRARVRAIACILLPLVAGCGGGGGGSESTPAETVAYDPATDPLVNPPAMFEAAPSDLGLVGVDETLVRSLEGNPNSLNPLFQSSSVESFVLNPLFKGLFTFNSEMKFMIDDEVVESFEESEDHLTYIIKMRPGLKWQDGHPFTAHDIEFSWRSIIDERVPCPAQRSGTVDVIECVALDDLTVKMVHREAFATNPWNAYFSVIPKHLYEKDQASNPDLKSGEYYNNLNRAPVGNGPYKFVRWLENDKIELERWDDYWGEKPMFKRMVFRIIPEQNIQMLSFSKGDTDEFRMNPKQFATQATAESDFAREGHKLKASNWTYLYICWNQDGSNPFFGDVRTRRAMTHALDVDRVISDLAYNLYTPCHGIFHPDSWMFNPEVKRYLFDLDQASALLDEAGWTIDESREGWRYKSIDGTVTRLEFTLSIPSGASISRDIAALYQEDLRSIGVKMDTQILEWATFVERNRKHEFQASVAAWGTGTDPDTNRNIWLSSEYDPEGLSGRNYGAFKSERVDELFELGRHEYDPEKRKAIYQEIHRIIYEDQPYTFIYNRGTFWAVNKRISGVQAGPRGIFSFDPGELGWWVRSQDVKYPLAAKS